jgi:aminoglycoside phosphotransferase (APT) family kinase protein
LTRTDPEAKLAARTIRTRRAQGRLLAKGPPHRIMADKPRMHDDEVSTDASLVRRLLAAQFPQWAGLPIEPVRSDGTDNAMYRLGGDLAARLPRRPGAVRPMDKEHVWVPRLAPRLPLPLPLPIAKGAPGEGYPWPWSVCRWLDGETPTPARIGDITRFADDLASFIRALQAIDAADAPLAGAHNHGRGAPLAQWQAKIAERLAWLADLGDIGRVTAAWEADAETPPWERPPVWIHGDLSAGNLLARAGRLSGVIDWNCLGAGDPACELQVAWTLFDDHGRQAFKAAMAVDEATWTRGRAWGLAMGVLNLSYYRARSPRLAQQAERAIAAVLADHARTRGSG